MNIEEFRETFVEAFNLDEMKDIAYDLDSVLFWAWLSGSEISINTSFCANSWLIQIFYLPLFGNLRVF